MKYSYSFLTFARLLLVAGGLVSSLIAQASPVGTGVGEVTLTIGQALIVRASGASVTAQRGSPIHPGDRIETAEGGHVHVRFMDGALVSVRPTSRLVVEDYQYNAAQVAQSLVRFRLEKGVTRAISGAAAEGARERFRLNTPLVAIGVRGTDFVVRTQADQTMAAVNQGAIVMAPFGESCLPQAAGPCGSPAARLLTADMGRMFVEFRQNLAQPELKPLNGMRPVEVAAAPVESRGVGDAASSRESPKRGVGDDALAAVLVKEAVYQVAGMQVAAASPVVPPATVSPSAPVLPIEPALPINPVMPSEPFAPDIPAAPAQLAWGRWGASLDTADATVPRAQAREGRVATVGNNDYILYRNESDPSTLSANLGNVSFALQQAQAHFTNAASQVLPASVQGGTLSLDFAARQFSTSLSLNSAPTGVVGLQAVGYIRDDGVFVARSADQAVAGAAAFDGKTAGYLFEKAAAGGTLSGITLWSRR